MVPHTGCKVKKYRDENISLAVAIWKLLILTRTASGELEVVEHQVKNSVRNMNINHPFGFFWTGFPVNMWQRHEFPSWNAFSPFILEAEPHILP